MVKAKRDKNVGQVVPDYGAIRWAFLFWNTTPTLSAYDPAAVLRWSMENSGFDIRITTPTGRRDMERMTTGTSRQLVGK